MISTEELERELFDKYGPYIPLNRIWQMLSYPSLEAARKAAARGNAPIECINLPLRRGVFMRTSDVSRWVTSALSVPENGAVSPPAKRHL